MFAPVPASPSFPELEQAILDFWREQRVYEQSLTQRADAPKFIFYEGPPTANGLPHPGHCLTRAIKDLFPRYRTMRGFLCERKAGWDTHGLPVEVEVCKELGIHSKEEIERFGVEPFIHKCQQSVWRYMQEWERLTERIGFWLQLDDAYVTYHQSYVESVWWSLKNLFERDLLYQGHKIVWWWAQGGTALSSGEVGLGYKDVADPSVYVRFPLLDQPGTSLLVWTTTPWTLPSNQFAAVHPELDYSVVQDAVSDERLILASSLVETVATKARRSWTVESTLRGSELVGRRYQPPFDYYYREQGEQLGRLRDGSGTQHIAWRVCAADFVTIESGTGVVHEAPAFGEVDFQLLLTEQARFQPGEGPPLICAVAADGTFTSEAPDYHGRWVKDADKEIMRELKTRGLLLLQDQVVHSYPFCWRADSDPLIQYPRRSWFIRTTQFRQRMLDNNQRVQWLPEHIRDGRFGNFLESNIDWALSRERYWGTPLPIWVCDETGRMEAIGSYAELLNKAGLRGTEVWAEAKTKNPALPEDLKVHKPYIDAISYDSPFAAGARMRRVPEVIDCWYDSGAMPFAQWGYPHRNFEQFSQRFPADFISEALDQTRGWFYSLMAISTMLFGDESQPDPASQPRPFPHPFGTCIVLGLMLAEWWESKDGRQRFLSEDEAKQACGEGGFVRKVGKMSKQLRNYRSPNEIFDAYGADALRWYFFANQAPWNSILYSERAIRESIPEYLLRLWNCYSFFLIYAAIDEFDPADGHPGPIDQLDAGDLAAHPDYRPIPQRSELDRWILGELRRTCRDVVQQMDAYDNYGACSSLHGFVDALSNWYVRRSRDRFWASDKADRAKRDAYWTLYECLLTLAKLTAPFTPFLAESLWRNLAGTFAGGARTSVHLCDYPAAADDAEFDRLLSERMQLLRSIASLGRSARMDNKLKVRQPLANVQVILSDTQHQAWLEAHGELLREELNVKQIEYTREAQKYIQYQVQPNFKRLGPRIGKHLPAVKAALQQGDPAQFMTSLQQTGLLRLEVAGEVIELDRDDIQVRLEARPGWAAAQSPGCVVVLSTDLTPDLLREGIAADMIRTIQERRKELACRYTDRIAVGIAGASGELTAAIEQFRDLTCQETLANSISLAPIADAEGVEREIADQQITLYVRTVA
jgi:isoleucyl-tRNA synthetase